MKHILMIVTLLVITHIFCVPTFGLCKPLTTAYLGVKNRPKSAKCSELCYFQTCG